MSEDDEFVTTEFDIFAQKPVQPVILETNAVHYKPIATVDQNDLEFLIPVDNETFIDLDIKLYVKGKLIGADGKDLDATDTAGTNNFLHSLFTQCYVSLNGANITPASELCPYRAYLETLLIYGSDAANSHLTNVYLYLDEGGDVLPGNPTSDNIKNKGFVKRWERQKQSKVTELYGPLHTDICNVPQFLLSGVCVQIKLTKAKDDFYLMNQIPIQKQKQKQLLKFSTRS